MKVLLTGATGFLGRSVARHLAARGHALHVLARPTSRKDGLPEGSETAIGDVTDAASFARAAEGCAAVLHLAALVKVWVPDPERFEVDVSLTHGRVPSHGSETCRTPSRMRASMCSSSSM